MRHAPVLLFVGVLATAAAWLWSTSGADAPVSPRRDVAVESAAPPPSRAGDPVHETIRAAEAPVVREPAGPLPGQGQAAADGTAQGFRGLVLDDRNQPLEGVQVFLLESAANDPLALPMILQQRIPMGPLAAAQTAGDGTFALGLGRVQEKTYALYFVSENHATAHLDGLRMLERQWHDVGAVSMVRGATVRGRVTVEGLGAPVPQAVVTLEVGTAFADVALRSLPGADKSLVATVDAGGFYELTHAPSRGVVRISAVAPGFARVVRQNIELSPDRPVEVDFGLPPGLTLGGQVHDAAGSPVANARVEAWPAQSSSMALVADTDRDGRFSVQGLNAGRHRVRVSAPGFLGAEQREVEAGRQDLSIALGRRGSARVRVLTPGSQVVRTFQLALRRWFDDRGGQIGFVADVADQRVRLDADSDFVHVDGIPVGTFVFEVEAEGYAKSWSRAFAIGAPETADQPREVDVVLSAGASLRGVITDEAGRPVEGATVATQTPGASADNPLWKLLAGAAPERVTLRKASTDAQGAFVLPLLSLGEYQLEVQHPDACLTTVRDIRLDAPGERTLSPIRMVAGAVVAGRATVGGRVAGQIKVVLVDTGNAGAPAAIRLETATDTDGFFRMPRRIPPGMYELRAAVVGTAEPDAQIFRQLLQLQRSSIPVVVAPGQPLVERDIDLPTDY